VIAHPITYTFLPVLLAYAFSIGTRNMGNSGSWRIVIALGLVFCLILGVGIFFVPESPRWLIEKGREEQARRAMARVRGLDIDHPLVNSDFDEQWAAHELDKRAGTGSWAQCFVGEGKDVHNKAPYRTMIMVVMMAFQQLTGANVSGVGEGEGAEYKRTGEADDVCLRQYFFYYGATIFQSVGIEDSFVTQLIVSEVSLAGDSNSARLTRGMTCVSQLGGINVSIEVGLTSFL
jgi:SP family sugar:H+ symporter-like MFS transporter